MAQPLTDTPRPTPWASPLALVLAAAVVIPAALIPLVPETYRPWGFAAFGAVALFTAARGGRIGLVAGLVLALGAKLAFDLMNYAHHGYDSQWLPMWKVYLCFSGYALLGWVCLRRTENPLWIAGITFASSLQFFLVTNFNSWLVQSLPYDRGLAGLLESYWMALPFWRGTLVSDLVFSGALFGLHAALSRAFVPAGQPARVPVENTPQG
jgi:hypothetical protein